jgi:pimeloyl-ACP methyl ester carboxylesterase
VSPLLRTAALPGMATLLALTIHPRLVGALWQAGSRLRRRGVSIGVYLEAIARALRPLENSEAQGAFLHTLRSVIDVHGQRVAATDRLYLLESIPTLIVWGERDNTIPIEHGRAAHEATPNSSFKTLAGAAHFPHLEDPQGLSELLREFIATTRPGAIADADWGAVLAHRSPRSRRLGAA